MAATTGAVIDDLFAPKRNDWNEKDNEKMGRLIRAERSMSVTKIASPRFRLKVPLKVIGCPDSIYRSWHFDPRDFDCRLYKRLKRLANQGEIIIHGILF